MVVGVIADSIAKYARPDDNYGQLFRTEQLPGPLRRLVNIFFPVLARENQKEPPLGIEEGEQEIYSSERIKMPLSQAIHYYETELLPELEAELREGRDLEKVTQTLKDMGLEALALRDIDQISGGQMQKVLLARAVCQEANYLLLDEPTSSLDLRHQLEVMEMIGSLVREKGVGAVMAMHDLNLASRFSDKVVMLDRGRVFCEGRPFDVITAENISAVYGVNATVIRNNGYPYVLPEESVKSEVRRVKGEG